MRLIRHPPVARDLSGLVDHIIEASRRLDEVDDLMAEVVANPFSGARLSAPLDGWLARHGDRDRRLTVVFRPERDTGTILVVLVAFGGQDWMS